MAFWLAKHFIKDYKNTNDPKVRQSYGFFSSIVGIIINIILFTGKTFAGIITGSISVIADAINNLSDAGSSVVTMIGFKISSTPADDEHPFGHGRAEYIAGLIISFIIILMGFELGKGSFEKIFSTEAITPNILSVVILGCSILFKLWLCYFNTSLGKKINSVSMKATAMDSLSDVASTSAVIIGIVVYLLTGVNIDAYIGLAVALFIIYTGIKTAKESLSPLIGQMPDEEQTKEIADTVCSYENIIGVHDMIIHNYGVGVDMVSLHVEVPANMDFSEAHELIDLIESDLRSKYNCHATIHMDPVVTDDEEINMLKEKLTEILRNIDSSITMHDFRKTNGVHQSNLIFDIVLPFKFRLTEAEIKAEIAEEIRKIDEKYNIVICIDRKMNKLD